MSNLLASKLGEKADGKVAAIAVIIRDEHILLGLREYEKAATVWTAPGGSVDNDESLESAVRREAREETGIDDLQFVGYIGEIKADDRDPLHIFHCQTDQDSQLTEPEKFSECRTGEV
jgi:ADP-ribose pyrophosphatase YjhB (NUDIX family)